MEIMMVMVFQLVENELFIVVEQLEKVKELVDVEFITEEQLEKEKVKVVDV
jgi:hypothetical protein